MADLQDKKSVEPPEPNRAKAAVQSSSETIERSGAAAQQAGQAGTEAMRQMGEAGEAGARRGVELFAEGQQRLMQHAAQRMEETSRKVAEAVEGSAQDFRKLMILPNLVGNHFGDLQKSMNGLVEGVMHSNLRAAEELFRATDPSAMFQIQRRFMHDYLDALMQGSAEVVRSVRSAADRTLEPLEHEFAQRTAAE
jgi:hypothetical protein